MAIWLHIVIGDGLPDIGLRRQTKAEGDDSDSGIQLFRCK